MGEAGSIRVAGAWGELYAMLIGAYELGTKPKRNAQFVSHRVVTSSVGAGHALVWWGMQWEREGQDPIGCHGVDRAGM